MPLADWKALVGLGAVALAVGFFDATAGLALIGVAALVTVMTHANVIAGWFGQAPA